MKMASIYMGQKIPDWFLRGVIAVLIATALISLCATALSDHEKIQDHDVRISGVEKRIDAMSNVPDRLTRVETEIHQNTRATQTLTEAILTGKVHRPKINDGDDK